MCHQSIQFELNASLTLCDDTVLEADSGRYHHALPTPAIMCLFIFAGYRDNTLVRDEMAGEASCLIYW